MAKCLVFDWGDTLMRDLGYPGPMVDWPRVELMPGVAQVLEKVSGKYMLCVASNAGDSDARSLAAALQRVGIRDHFQIILTSKELGHNKPDLAFFRAIPDFTGFAVQEHLMIGNDCKKDIEPAKAVGMQTVYILTDAVSDCPSADFVINSPAHLKQLLD